MSADKAFKSWQKQLEKNGLIITHQLSCPFTARANIPIDECSCDCYRLALFTAGYKAAKGIAIKSVGVALV